MNLMVTTNQKLHVTQKLKGKESKHNTEENHLITSEESRRKVVETVKIMTISM